VSNGCEFTDSGIVLRDGKVYPACVVGDPAAMAALDERYDQMIARWDSRSALCLTGSGRSSAPLGATLPEGRHETPAGMTADLKAHLCPFDDPSSDLYAPAGTDEWWLE
jgi:hypothetical protein